MSPQHEPRPSEQPAASGTEDPFLVRELRSTEDFEASVRLQRAVWGAGFTDCVPATLQRVARKTGGLVAGAFREEELQGLVLGFGAVISGAPSHWSHMLGVRGEARGHGLGMRLKLFQRELLMERGITEAYWTFDPLVARNAHLNLNRLGAEVAEYVVDMYGDQTGSRLHGAMATDRLIVRWRLGGERARAAIGGAFCGSEERADPGARLLSHSEGSVRARRPPPADDRVYLEVPADVSAVLRDAPPLASAWRLAAREAFLDSLERGYAVTAFVTTRERRSYYVLERESPAPSTLRP